jgi:hypothetical protein
LSFDFGIYESGIWGPRLLGPTLTYFLFKVIVNEENAHDTQEFLTKRLSAIKNQRSTGELEDLALVIGTPPDYNILRLFTFRCRRWEESWFRSRERSVKNVSGIGYHVQSRDLL